jgi:Asp-tRNA(Asn)/Glu-tRNA(Gln) amidotransferase A subunit family amidase
MTLLVAFLLNFAVQAAPARASFDVLEKSIDELQRALTAREVTSRELVDLYLARIAAYDQHGPSLNAITVTNPRAREQASELDAERALGRLRGPLHGIPILVKDNYETIEMPTSAGSIALVGFHPRRDAYLVERLKKAGAIVIGKTNMHELAAGITTVGSRFGRTRNPYDLDRNPGGSSGGTGAAVAANFAAAGMGSDTCGSIRNPASHNNLVGLRGTQGLSSRTGIVPLSSTQDIGGPIARSIADLSVMLDATVGPDPADRQTTASTGRIPTSFRSALRADALKDARIGVARSLFGTVPEDQEVGNIIQKSLDGLRKAGAEVFDVVIPGLDDLLRDSSMITHDFKFDLAEYLARNPDAPVKSLEQILDRGLYHTALESTFRMRNAVQSRDSDAARRARIKQAALRRVLESVLEEHRLTAILYPTLRRKPARIGEAQGGSNCQVSAHSGLPALALPAGFTDDGLPVGTDLLGAAFSEQQLLSLGYSIEKVLQVRRSPFSTPPLMNGKAPAPQSIAITIGSQRISLSYDQTTAVLSYTMNVSPSFKDGMTAIWLHGGTPGKPGSARHLLYSTGGSTTGTITLSSADRRDLADGHLMLRLYLPSKPGSAADVTLHMR